MTNPRNLDVYDATFAINTVRGTEVTATTITEELFYCGNEVTEYTYGGCHFSCKSCYETYNRDSLTRGPVYQDLVATLAVGRRYGKSDYCYDCYDAHYLAASIETGQTDIDLAGTCTCTLILLLY